MKHASFFEHVRRAALGVVCLCLVATTGCRQESRSPGSRDKATGAAGSSCPAETKEAMSCDGTNTVKVAADLTGRTRADALLDQWKRDHPDRDWVEHEKEAHRLTSPADNSAILEGGQGKGDAYGDFTEMDLLVWARETEKFVAEGSRIFHNGDALGSTVGVSCDMCHPHAANTHPETYPKFQTQLGRVVLLRDMINWCIENPVRGKKLEADSPEMRALEAYIMSQRKGVEMNYGKH